MRLTLSSLALLCIFALASEAMAQPRALRRRTRPEPKGRAVGHDKTPPGHAKKSQEEICRSRSAMIAQQQQRLNDARGELAGIDAELAQLRRRIDELQRDRAQATELVSRVETNIRSIQGVYDRDCAQNETCQQYESLAGTLESQGKDIEARLASVRDQMSKDRNEMRELQARIDPLRREYNSMKCNDLVPGETAQSTIDRCSALFSEWNRLQTRLNYLNSRLTSLKSQYEQLFVQLRGIESRGSSYGAYLARHCSSSPKVKTMRGYGAVRERAEKLGRELDDLIQNVTKLRGIRITVTP